MLVGLRKGPPRLVEKVASFVPGMFAKVVVPEGYSSYQIAERLEASGVCPSEGFLEACRDAKLLEEFGIPLATAEGFLYPATYGFLTDEDPLVVVRRMLETDRERSAGIDFAEAPTVLGKRLGVAEVVTLASIVEKETSVPEERGRIARVFLNRLGSPEGPTRGRLESDPTANYGCLATRPKPSGCPETPGKVTPEMLRDASNPFNTYRIAGLPPGPIGNPGKASILAVLEAPFTDELFFVADGTGRHAFSRTYEEHLAAVARLRERGRSR